MKKYACITPQDQLTEIFPNVYLLRGSIKIAPMLQMNRNMVVVRDSTDLTIINAVRLNDKNTQILDRLGKVKHVIRLGDFHGLDDQFYLDRYQAKFWSQSQHQTYQNLVPNKIIDRDAIPPIPRSKFFIFSNAKFPESALLLEDTQLLITTDSIQYWDDWKHVSLLSRMILYLMGFRLGLFIGGPWLKKVSSHKNSLKENFDQLLNLDFTSLVAAHGNLLQHHAKPKLTDIIAKTFNDIEKGRAF